MGQVAVVAVKTKWVIPHGEYNIVFMGMGEPLHNLDNVLAALGLLTDEKAFGLGPRRITVFHGGSSHGNPPPGETFPSSATGGFP